MAIRFSSLLQRWGKLSVTQPLAQFVDANDEDYLLHTGIKKLGWRHFRRLVYFRLSGQCDLCRPSIPPGSIRCLWLYCGVPQIGDALMDLAPRSLLQQSGIRVDLYTEPHLATLFATDRYFEKIWSSPDDLKSAAYDFVIVPSNKRRSLKIKAKYLPLLPWLSMQGFYTGPEFHRAKFATQRLLEALAMTADTQQFNFHSRQKLSTLPSAGRANDVRRLKLAIAVGGVDPRREYLRWHDVVRLLVRQFDVSLTLLGSENGSQAGKDIESAWPGKISNQVGRTSLAQCRNLINEQDVFISCDGGLMHLALTTSAHLVSLFQSSVSPRWRLPDDLLGGAIQSATIDVNAISPESILEKVHTARARSTIA